MTKVFLGMLLMVRMLYHYSLIGKNEMGYCQILIKNSSYDSYLRLFQ
jgi:hypothetical protein